MSVPTFPDTDPISGVDAANMLLASIAFEELALAHLINSEAEKIQFVLGTVDGQKPLCPDPTIEDLLDINQSVEQMLRNVIKTEIMLQFKLEDVLGISTSTTTTTTTTTTSTTTTKSTTTHKPHWDEANPDGTEPVDNSDPVDVPGDNLDQ